MERLEYIDNYFKGELIDEEKKEFERRIEQEREFAEDVAFYLSASQVARQQVLEDKKSRFKEIYEQDSVALTGPAEGRISTIKRFWPYLAAASVLAVIVLSWFFFVQSTSPQHLATKYIQSNEFHVLGQKMGGGDSLETGKSLYNNRNYSEALQLFERILQSDQANVNAIEYAGRAALKMEQYEKALSYFSQLENNKSLFSNPGKFYHALTLMKRNLPGDQQLAKQLLQQVVDENQEKKHTAQEFLEQL